MKKFNIQLFGEACPPLYGKSVKFYERAKEKALIKIAKLQEVVKECEAALASKN